jgi:sulfonate transport system permease protein
MNTAAEHAPRAFSHSLRFPWPFGHSWAVERFIRRLLWAACVPLSFLTLWYCASRYAWIPAPLCPSPLLVLQSIGELWNSGELALHITSSFFRVLGGFALGAAFGLGLGLSLGLSRTFDAAVHPTFQVISQIPALAFIPFAMMIFGLGELLKFVVIAKAVAIPIALNTRQGLRGVPQAYLEVARIYEFRPVQVFSEVILPYATTLITTGLRYGLSNAWQALVTVELLASSEGLGYLMVWGRQLFQLDLVLIGILAVGVLGYVLDRVFLALEASRTRWRRLAFEPRRQS